MKITTSVLAAVLALGLSPAALAETIKADVWVDNWFAFYLNENLVVEDSVPITTERSFNAEQFSFEAERPFALNFIVKDFRENDTGLEYIGSNRQQMGDGGFIAQFASSAEEIVAVTNADWRCLVIHEAPLGGEDCARVRDPQAGSGACGYETVPEPSGWKTVAFDDSAWPVATEYTAREVGPKDGYDEISWAPEAQLIWGPNLKTNNTLLCRMVVE